MGFHCASRKFAIWSQLMSRIAGWGDGQVPSLRTKGLVREPGPGPISLSKHAGTKILNRLP